MSVEIEWNNVNYVHIFDDQKGKNILGVTKNDTVFSLGANLFGCLGLGNNECINTPQIIPNLCYKNIREFFVGKTFVLALSTSGQVYGWGENNRGQLGRGSVNKSNEYLKPYLVSISECVIQLSCGESHTLALTSQGHVYGWGSNSDGQVGCGPHSDLILKPTKILSETHITFISCHDLSSFAITNDGFVFSWGSNVNYILGHNCDENEKIFTPTQIETEFRFKTVYVTHFTEHDKETWSFYLNGPFALFLSYDGYIYYCGYDRHTKRTYRRPVVLNNDQTSETHITYNSKTKESSFVSILNNELKFTALYRVVYTNELARDRVYAATQTALYTCSLSRLNIYSKCGLQSEIHEIVLTEFLITLSTIKIKNHIMTAITAIVSQMERRMHTVLSVTESSDEIIWNNVKYVHIFDDQNGKNILYVTKDDTVFGLGANMFGCLGLGNNECINTPQIIQNLCHKNIREFCVGKTFVLALNFGGQVYGWGENNQGQLGRGTVNKSTEYLKPYLVSISECVIQLSCGESHALALTSQGHVYGWGSNTEGQVGCGTHSDLILKPTKILSETHITFISCHDLSSFAITSDGFVFSWGSNLNYILGHNCDENENIFTPTQIESAFRCKTLCTTQFVTFDANTGTYPFYGPFTLFLSDDGSVYYCGYNTKTKLSQRLPQTVNTSLKFNAMYCVKSGFELNKTPIIGVSLLGDTLYTLKDLNVFTNEAIAVSELNEFILTEFKITFATIKITANITTAIAEIVSQKHCTEELAVSGRNGEIEWKSVNYVHVFDDQKGKNILFVKKDNTVYGLGSNRFGCLGLGNNDWINRPQIIPILCHKNIREFCVGKTFVLALTTDGQVYGWGENNRGQLGRDSVNKITEYLEPHLVSISECVIQLSCGESHALALTSQGHVYGWGSNTDGQVGCGPHSDLILKPTKILSETHITFISCHDFSSFAITSDGFVFSWGSNLNNILGHNCDENENIFTPTQIVTEFTFKTLYTINFSDASVNGPYPFLGHFTLFLSKDERIYYCGYNTTTKQRQLSPKLLDNRHNCGHQYICSVKCGYNHVDTAIIAVSNTELFTIKYLILYEKYDFNYETVNEFILSRYRITAKTIALNASLIEILVEKIDIQYNTSYSVNEFFTIFSDYHIFAKVDETKRKDIALFYVFYGRSRQNNCIYVTKEDTVYALGANVDGVLGLGHDSPVDDPQPIPVLCRRNICEFRDGENFVLALTGDHRVYSWGDNSMGELGRGLYYTHLQMPDRVVVGNDETIAQISCGRTRSVVLTTGGRVYEWGGRKGQLTRVVTPMFLENLHDITYVCCSLHASFALTSKGYVYSWGTNFNCILGYELGYGREQEKPKRIHIKHITYLCSTLLNTYFLNAKGQLYYCGAQYNAGIQHTPKRMDTRITFTEISDRIASESFIGGVSKGGCHVLDGDQVHLKDYDNFQSYCSKNFAITYKTVETAKYGYNGKYGEEFVVEPHGQIGQGGFGIVYCAMNKCTQKAYAIKKVCPKIAIINPNKEKALREMAILKRLDSDFVVRYHNSWIEYNQYIYIQMDFCSANLRQLLSAMAKTFNEITAHLSYFLCCELIAELIEGLVYLHSLQPPIIHRDLKPENVLIDANAVNGIFCKICDFGLAIFDDKKYFKRSQRDGTFKYTAPEVTSSTEYTYKSDIYSLGIIAMDIIEAPRVAFHSHPGIIRAKYSVFFEIIEQMTSKSTAQRPELHVIKSLLHSWSLCDNDPDQFECTFADTSIIKRIIDIKSQKHLGDVLSSSAWYSSLG